MMKINYYIALENNDTMLKIKIKIRGNVKRISAHLSYTCIPNSLFSSRQILENTIASGNVVLRIYLGKWYVI